MKKITLFVLYFIFSLTIWAQSIITTYPMNVKRMNHLHTEISGDKILLIGGHGTDFISLNTAEIFDPQTHMFTMLNMNSTHDNSSFVKLNDGKLLILGGSADLGIAPGNNIAELFDENTNTFSLVSATMNYGRMIFGSTVLGSGNVLIAGGWYDEPSATYGEVFNPNTNTFTVTGALNTPRSYPTIVPTSDGKATIFGGGGIYGNGSFQKVEEYDPSTNQFTAVSDYFFPGEANWSLNYSTKLGSRAKMYDGRYLYVIYNSDSLKYRLMTFDPITKTFAKFYTDTELDLPDSASVLDIVLYDYHGELGHFFASIVFSYPDAGGTRLGYCELAEPNYSSSNMLSYFTYNYYFSFASVDGFNTEEGFRLLICGGTTLDNFTPVDNTLIITPCGVGVKEINNNIPTEYSLAQNYPNPFNPSTKIRFSLNTSGNVSLKIYDILGKEITTLVDKYMDAGNYEADFNTSDVSKNLTSGVYIYQLKLKDKILSNKMMILK